MLTQPKNEKENTNNILLKKKKKCPKMSWVISQVLSKGTYTQNMSLRSQNSNQSNQGGKSKIPGLLFLS